MDPGSLLGLRHAHVGLVAVSVALFAARGLGVMAGAAWPMKPLPRWGSVVIDTVLLATGVTLAVAMTYVPFVNAPWLGWKLLLLLAYILLGSYALKRARTRGGRLIAFVAALATVALMAGMARHHHVSSWFAPWWMG